MSGIYDMMDVAIAEALHIPVLEYIDRVEWLCDQSQYRANTIIGAILSGDENENTAVYKKGLRLFMEATTNYDKQG